MVANKMATKKESSRRIKPFLKPRGTWLLGWLSLTVARCPAGRLAGKFIAQVGGKPAIGLLQDMAGRLGSAGHLQQASE